MADLQVGDATLGHEPAYVAGRVTQPGASVSMSMISGIR
jgi:hypothetical protein